jgi:putative hydrolase
MSMPFGFGAPGDPDDPRSNPAFDMSSLGAALQQLGAMLQAGEAAGDQPVNWDLVTDVARKALVAAGDPSVADAQRRAVVEAVRLADVWLDAVVTFPATGPQAEAWSRSEWLAATLPTWRTIITPIAEHMQAAVAPGPGMDLETLSDGLPEQMKAMLPDGIPPEMAQMLAPMMGMVRQLGAAAFSMQVGQALAGLAAEVLSASDIGVPLTPSAQVALLPRTVEEFAGGLGVSHEDVLLYLALRESAHQRLFAHVPWLRPRMIGAVEEYARGVRVDSDRLSEAMGSIDINDPQALQSALSSGVLMPEDTEEQRAAIARLETLLALVEGWVDDVVGTAIAERLPSAERLRETMRRRRAAGGPAEKTFATLVGMDLRPRLAREAATLFAIVRTQRGQEGRDSLWEHPDLLPAPDDLADPLGFVVDSSDGLTLGDPDGDEPPADPADPTGPERA